MMVDTQLKTPYSRNLAWILDSDKDRSLDDKNQYIDIIVLNSLAELKDVAPKTVIKQICTEIDVKFKFKSGTSLGSLRRLLAKKLINVALNRGNIPNLLIDEFTFV